MFSFYRRQRMSQRELSDITGIPLSTIKAYEYRKGNADINKANPTTIFKIALALNIPAYRVVDDPELVKLMKQERELK